MTAGGAAVRVTGMGIVSSIGHDVAAFGQSLAAGKSGIRRLMRETTPPLAVRCAPSRSAELGAG